MPYKIKQIIKSAEMLWLSTETVFFPKYLKCHINRKSIRYQEIPERLTQRKPRLKDTIYISS